MTFPYTSIFNGSSLITKKNLCEILNLDTSRPGLEFSHAEIQKAYKKRAMRFHPDKQSSQNPSIPAPICNILMMDIKLSRDYMLRGEDNIPGKSFVENSKNTFTTAAVDLVDVIIKILDNIRAGSSQISSTVPWLSRFSNSFFIVLLLSTFSDGELNLLYVNIFSKELDNIRPYLKDLDENFLVDFLIQIKNALMTAESLHHEALLTQFKKILPETLIKDAILDKLVEAIQSSSKQLKTIFTNDFIAHIKHIVHFWIHFLATVPKWTHILGVYFISLLFTSTSLPKFFNATKMIIEVILKQKGMAALVLILIPLAVLNASLLPLNIAIQFGWVALKIAFQIIIDSIQLVYSAINMVLSLFNKPNMFILKAFSIFENTINLTLRLTFNVVVDILDEIIFMASDYSLVSSLQSSVNSWLDAMMDTLRPNEMNEKKIVLATKLSNKTETPKFTEESTQKFSFFEHTHVPLHNAEDVWLNQLLRNIFAQNDEVMNDQSVSKVCQ